MTGGGIRGGLSPWYLTNLRGNSFVPNQGEQEASPSIATCALVEAREERNKKKTEEEKRDGSSSAEGKFRLPDSGEDETVQEREGAIHGF